MTDLEGRGVPGIAQERRVIAGGAPGWLLRSPAEEGGEMEAHRPGSGPAPVWAWRSTWMCSGQICMKADPSSPPRNGTTRLRSTVICERRPALWSGVRTRAGRHTRLTATDSSRDRRQAGMDRIGRMMRENKRQYAKSVRSQAHQRSSTARQADLIRRVWAACADRIRIGAAISSGAGRISRAMPRQLQSTGKGRP